MIPSFQADDFTCSEQETVDQRSLGYHKLISLFALPVLGAAAGLVIFAIEILGGFMKKSSRNGSENLSRNGGTKTSRYEWTQSEK